MNTPARKTTPVFRALTQYSKLPTGHKTFRVGDDGSAPHLKEREFAVIDMTDRELQNGELYLIQHESGNRSRHVVQIRTEFLRIGSGRKERVWWCGDLAGWRNVGAVNGIQTFAGLSDGPYRPENLQGKLVGRVVGFSETALGDLLPLAAGYENEEAGNAAFDPAEYLDVMIQTGHQPYLMRGRDGHLSYGEKMPDRPLTQQAAAVVMAESGVTAPELCAVFGWSKLETAEIYIRAAQKRTMAGNAFARIDEHRNRKSVSVLKADNAAETNRRKNRD